MFLCFKLEHQKIELFNKFVMQNMFKVKHVTVIPIKIKE